MFLGGLGAVCLRTVKRYHVNGGAAAVGGDTSVLGATYGAAVLWRGGRGSF